MRDYSGKSFQLLLATLVAIALTVVACSATGCGDGSETTDTNDAGGVVSISNTLQDQAARLAAQAQLRNAQTAQDTFFTNQHRYASSTGELKSTSPGLNPKVQVMPGDKNGYEMQVVANDSARTVFIVRNTGTRIERLDADGNPW